jgi:hypothetical protein
MKDANDTATIDLLPAPRRRGRPTKLDGAQTPAQRKAAQRERERLAFVTYSADELERVGTAALAAELGRLVVDGRPALASAVWKVLQARACASRAELHPEQEAQARADAERLARACR